MHDDPPPHFLEWMENHDRRRESIDSARKRRIEFNNRGHPDDRGPSEIERQAFEIRMAMFPGLTATE